MKTTDRYQLWAYVPSSGWIPIGMPKSHEKAHAEMQYLRGHEFLFKVEVRKYDA